MGFLRGGYSDDGNALLERSLSTGFGWKSNKRGDVLGLGINWGRPNHYVTGSVRDQYTAELYYLWQIRKNIQITPDMQILHHPALNPNHDTITLFGVRARFVF